MRIFERVRSGWRGWRSKRDATTTEASSVGNEDAGAAHVALARESLGELLNDARVPAAVRSQLESDYEDVRRMLDKLEHGHVHIAAFGRVGVGKSSLLNALLGQPRFSTSPLHGETTAAEYAGWREERSGGVFLIDTPGIDEIGGEDRERIARETAGRADLLLFVAEADLTTVELDAMRDLAAAGRPMLLVLNKSDRYSDTELQQLHERLAGHTSGLVGAEDIIPVTADPPPETVVMTDSAGAETTQRRPRPPDVEALRLRLWEILDAEGKTLAAVNASLFAGHLSDAIGERVVEARSTVAEQVVRTWSIAKGVAVALNPVPVADLFAAAMVDASMVVHLSRVYGLPLSRREAGSLISVVVTQMAALMGTVWAVHLLSAALKAGTGGMSVVLTAGAQGAVAYYSTYVVGRAAERYFALGKSWGDGGPATVVEEILETTDRDSILKQARGELRRRLARERS